MTESGKESEQSTGQTEPSIQNSTEESNQSQKNEKGELKLELNTDHIAVIKREYKKVRRYMKSSIYQVRMMDGTEKVVNELLDKYYKEEDAKE